MQIKESRTKNTILNFLASSFGQVIVIIFSFATRTVFIQTLGKEYLGISSLFANIITMLSLAEFGFGSAILFKLYKPIVDNDKQRIKVLMKFYKIAYRAIGLVVLVFGLCLIPFLPFMIKNYDSLAVLNINAALIFSLYLLQSVSTYLFFAYKNAIVKAHQKEYVLTFTGYFFTIATYAMQIVMLVLTKSFVLYILIVVISNILQNLVYAYISEKMFPYMKEKTNAQLDKDEVRSIFKDCSALFLYKIDSFVMNATDNIILASQIGLAIVGMYSNYLLFFTTLKGILMKFYDALVASLGNLHQSSNIKHEYKIFGIINFITAFLYGTASIGLAVQANEVISTWIGSDYLLPQSFVVLLAIQFYTLGLRIFLAKFRTSMGLFQQAKFRPIASILINLIVSISLVNSMGIHGVILGTIIADWCTVMWYDAKVIYKHGFNNYKRLSSYFSTNFKYLLVVLIGGCLSYILCNLTPGIGWLYVILDCIICVIISILMFYIFYKRSTEFKYLSNTARNIISKIIKRTKRG